MLYIAIKSLLNPKIIQDIDQELRQVKLTENAKEAKLKSLLCCGLDENTVVFKLDKNHKDFSKKSAFLNPTHKNIHKGCDYVIITKYENKNVIIFCELKSNNISGAKNQLFCSIPFIDYLISLLKTHKNVNINEFERHFVIFSSASRLRKQRTKNTKLESVPYENIKIKLVGAPVKINIGKILR